MNAPDQSKADLDWRDDLVPVSRRFDDPYFSLAGGLDETRHVFLAGNDLAARLRPGFHVAELGFGTGLNLLALRLACPEDCPIRFTSFEAYPMEADEIARALDAFPEVAPVAGPYLEAWAAGQPRLSRAAWAVEQPSLSRALTKAALLDCQSACNCSSYC